MVRMLQFLVLLLSLTTLSFTACLAQAQSSLITHAKATALSPQAQWSDSPGFLGPRQNGKYPETHLLKTFGKAGPRLLWSYRKGPGYSAPSVVKDHLIFFHGQPGRETVVCLDPETGAEKWVFSYESRYQDRYGYNSGPRSSPLIRRDKVYTYGVEAKLSCLDLLRGELLWQRDLRREFRLKQNFFGMGSTPLVVDGVLAVQIGAPQGPCVIGLDPDTGKHVWQTAFQTTASYASIVEATLHDATRLLVLTGGDSRPPEGSLLSINPGNGVLDFSYPFRSHLYESATASNPVVQGNQVFVSASYQTGCALLTVNPDYSSTVAWKNEALGTHFNTAVLVDGYLYGFDGRHKTNAALVCLDWQSGREMWRERLQWQETYRRGIRNVSVRKSPCRGQLIYADSTFYCLGELGHLLTLDLSPQGCRVLSRAWLFDAADTWSPPVLSRGLLYVLQHRPDAQSREPAQLRCYDLRGP